MVAECTKLSLVKISGVNNHQMKCSDEDEESIGLNIMIQNKDILIIRSSIISQYKDRTINYREALDSLVRSGCTYEHAEGLLNKKEETISEQLNRTQME